MELIGHIARDELRADGVLPAEPALIESSFPRRREPIPGPGEPDSVRAEPAEAPAPADTGSSFPADASSFPSSREPIPAPAADESPNISTKNSKPKTKNFPGPAHGLYDIDRKIAEAQRDPAHPIHKFVQAYDEVAAAFHGEDNDDDEEVRYWISGEVPDAYGKYIWEYAPANPRSVRRRLRPRRRRSTPKAESVWMKRPADKMREAGIPRPKRTLMWI